MTVATKARFVRKAVNLEELIASAYGEKQEFVIEKKVELDAETFKRFSASLLEGWDFIQSNTDFMYGNKNVMHCILICTEGNDIGILVESEGYDYARYAAVCNVSAVAVRKVEYICNNKEQVKELLNKAKYELVTDRDEFLLKDKMLRKGVYLNLKIETNNDGSYKAKWEIICGCNFTDAADSDLFISHIEEHAALLKSLQELNFSYRMNISFE